MAVAELTLLPIGTKTTSVSKYIAGAIDVLKKFPEVEYELNPMGTVLSHKDVKTLYEVIYEMQESVFNNGVNRVYTVIKIDDRRDKNYTFRDKVKSVNEKLKKD